MKCKFVTNIETKEIGEFKVLKHTSFGGKWFPKRPIGNQVTQEEQ
jgi:hypothetical protein